MAKNIHIEEIRRRLWNGGEVGNAAVMVGAGFSRFSTRVGVSAQPMPLWRDLGSQLYRQLHSDTVTPDHQVLQRAAEIGYLRLASQFECAFGRATLDEQLQRWTPHTLYRPGPLHDLLLRLPWADVFSTNYDDLLERASEGVTERRYGWIRSAEDLPGSAKPRIVKLHGTFPSQRPFVITEEDYREYPKTSAILVNTVQQALTENAFCLLGFSGDDPNFLHWTGWVRDNLGRATPKIYLIGLLELSSAARQLLELRNIVPLDLSQHFPRDKWPTSDARHFAATEWLLLSLYHGKPPNPAQWGAGQSYNWSPARITPNLPPCVPRPGPRQPKLFAYGENDSTSAKTVEDVARAWARVRADYPGWLVAPRSVRKLVRDFTLNWVHTVLARLDEMEPPWDLHVLHELTWRMEVCMIPLFEEWHDKATATIRRYAPLPPISNSEAEFTASSAQSRFTWSKLVKPWSYLIEAALRHSRQILDPDAFQTWHELARQTAQFVPNVGEWATYENALFGLYTLDSERALTSLATPTAGDRIPPWMLRRAGLLAELGESKEATQLAHSALREIRRGAASMSGDRRALSLEGWAMLILHNLATKFPRTPEYRERWQQLEAYHCNPLTEMEFLWSALDHSPPRLGPHEELRVGFDPDRQIRTQRLSVGLEFETRRAGYELLSMHDRVGIPFRANGARLHSDSLSAAAKWIYPFDRRRALGVLLRAGRDADIKEVLDRPRVAGMKKPEIEFWISNASKSLRAVSPRDQYGGDDREFPEATVASELASRLAFRLDATKAELLLNIAISLFAPGPFALPGRGMVLERLFERLFISASDRTIGKVLLSLLESPVAGAAEPNPAPPDWPEPMTFLLNRPQPTCAVQIESPRWKSAISHLTHLVRHGGKEARRRATQRLACVSLWNMLTPEQDAEFGAALWSQTDARGVPEGTGLRAHAFTELPHPANTDPLLLLQDYLLQAQIPGYAKFSDEAGRVSLPLGASNDCADYFLTLRYASLPRPRTGEEQDQFRIQWSANNAQTILEKFQTWLKSEAATLGETTLAISDIGATTYILAAYTLAKVVVPELDPTSATTGATVKAVAESFKAIGLDLPIMHVALLRWFPELLPSVVVRFETEMKANSHHDEEHTAAALGYWYLGIGDSNVPAPPARLIQECLNRIAHRRAKNLAKWLSFATSLVKYSPGSLNKDALDTIIFGLTHLLEESRALTEDEREKENDSYSTIPILQRPAVRKRAAELAVALSKAAARLDETQKERVEHWLTAIGTDPLPEVRGTLAASTTAETTPEPQP